MDKQKLHDEIVMINKWWQHLAAVGEVPTKHNTMIGVETFTPDELQNKIAMLDKEIALLARSDGKNARQYKGWRKNLVTARKYVEVAQGKPPKTKQLRKMLCLQESRQPI